MSGRTTITVSEETKSDLDEARGDLPWDAFLRSLIQNNSDGELTEDHIDDIVSRTSQATADELEARLR